jgi:hypothetical protein
MIPKVVTKQDSDGKRTGFDITGTEVFGDPVAYADLSDEWLWSLRRTDGGWMLGKDGKFLSFEKTSDQKIRATLESDGDVLVIDGALGEFTFTTNLCSLDYNDRSLINGYAGSPATFYIYRYVGYDLNISGGVSAVGEVHQNTAIPNETVTITPTAVPAGKVFDKWVIIKGDIELDDAQSPKATFNMVNSEICIEATYKDAPAGEPKVPSSSGLDLTALICVGLALIALIEAGAIVLMVYKKRKLK